MPRTEEKITVNLTKAESLVLFELLSRTDETDWETPIKLIDQSEKAVLSNILCELELVLAEPFDNDYPVLLKKARTFLRYDDYKDLTIKKSPRLLRDGESPVK